MNNNKYIELAHVTCSDQFYGNRVIASEFLSLCDEIIKKVDRLDALKKQLFYKPVLLAELDENLSADYFKHVVNVNVIHGIVGAVTESGELLEALINSLKTGDAIDFVNIEEESGDLFWYLALIAKACYFTFEEAQTTNIKKLKKRYGEKFSEHAALNRDLDGERKVLEKVETEIENVNLDVAKDQPTLEEVDKFIKNKNANLI